MPSLTQEMQILSTAQETARITRGQIVMDGLLSIYPVKTISQYITEIWISQLGWHKSEFWVLALPSGYFLYFIQWLFCKTQNPP